MDDPDPAFHHSGRPRLSVPDNGGGCRPGRRTTQSELGRWVTDRWLLGLGLLLVAIGGVVAAAAEGFAGLAAGRLVSGAGFVLSSLYFTKVTVDWFAGRELATAMAVTVMSWPFGIAMGQVGHGWLALHQSWQAPFAVGSVYALLSALAVVALYQPPAPSPSANAPQSARLTGREWTLTLIAAVVWAAFNGAYVIYLSFAPKVLTGAGMSALAAASVVSAASWVMIFSGALCGQLADRFGRADLILTICLVGGMVSFALLPQVEWALATCLAYGLIGVAPAGLIVALTGEAMAPHKRAFGMGVFQSLFFILTAAAPAAAGWLFDRTRNPFVPILFAITLMAAALLVYHAFRLVQRRTA